MNEPTLTHVDEAGAPAMVDVHAKAVTWRLAIAEARVVFPPAAAEALRAQGFSTAKGPVFHTAIIAGTQAAKQTHHLIPFCHALQLERCKVAVTMEGDEAVVRCEAGSHHRTGVEMEALTGASVAALTIYDMCKALTHGLRIEAVRLLEKTGGKADYHAD
ncbi:MAG: hypothetical protein RJB26_2630 [Pseudomonadota bacterium]